MATFIINKGYSSAPWDGHEVEADYFETRGDFIDFDKEGSGTVYRVSAKYVHTIELISP